jgi:dipeptidyl aminopeptidase/acylaminoacyl peptidase
MPIVRHPLQRSGLGLAAFVLTGIFALTGAAEEAYKTPPADVVRIFDAPTPPTVVPSPTGEAMLLLDYEAYPPIDLLARPFHRLAGVRVDPALGAKRREFRILGIRVQELSPGSQARRIALPDGATLGFASWSPDASRIAFTRDAADGIEVWVCDAKSLQARPIKDVRLNDVLGSPLRWTRDNRHLLVRSIRRDRGPEPGHDRLPSGPRIQETAGKTTRMATFQDLLVDAHDEDLFEHYATSQLLLVDSETGEAKPLGTPGLYAAVDPSPNGEMLLVKRLARPFSFRVPQFSFAHTLEIWSADGRQLGTLAQLPVADEVPQQGVATGVRDVGWQPLQPATLVWAEALDGGDPRAKVPHRDRLVLLDVAKALETGDGRDLATRGREVLRLEERFRNLTWTGQRNRALMEDYDRDRRWTTAWLIDVTKPAGAPRQVFDRSVNDAYADPGRPVMRIHPTGEFTMRQDGDTIYLSGRGSTPSGDRPFVDGMQLGSLAKKRLFESDAASLETFVAFVSKSRVLTTHQSRTAPPNQFLVDVPNGKRTQLTDYVDPAPQLAGIEKRLLKYRRKDGTQLTGFLYLPPGYEPGTQLPVMLWAYPREFSDAGTAGQVRGSENTFVRPTGASHLYFLTQGYAVLDDPTMPVLGDPETMNETYVEQIVTAAQAAVDTLVAMGIADPARVGIGGHSYGAFMTANLLAHSQIFAAGIARSGAYNRTLTPFGFQSERRSFWEARETYLRMSPFMHADKIDEPILLIHGEDDTNSGTFPIQTERLFQALQGNGATARLVMLPYEAHTYRGRESVLHTIAEMIEWADTWVKHPARELQESRR